MARAGQLADQRSVLPDPLVQWKTPLKYQRLQQIGTNLSHAIKYSHLLPNVWTIPPSHFRDDRRVSPLPGTVIWRGLLLCPKAVESLYGVNIRFFLFLE